MTIFLCGFMGCGKSTVGAAVAKKLGCGVCDTDEMIVKLGALVVAVRAGHLDVVDLPIFRQAVQVAVDRAATDALIHSANVQIDLIRGGMIAPRPHRLQNDLPLPRLPALLHVCHFPFYCISGGHALSSGMAKALLISSPIIIIDVPSTFVK